jgi:protein-L-isoaspartate(D-aspartate) O-methyltransferase
MAANAAAYQSALVKRLHDNGSLSDPAIAAAFLAVPRHAFLPGLPLADAYADEAIPVKLEDGHPISSSSQPSMMAIMLEQLALAPGQRVLEIGAGTGYNAALMGRLVGPDGCVVTVDIDDDLVAAARAHLEATGTTNVIAVCADGALGHPPLAPYDRLILTVGTWDLAPAWLDQLKPGGRLVVPLALAGGGQKSVAFVKASDPAAGRPVLVSTSVRDCAFMRLRGVLAGPERLSRLGPDSDLALNMATDLPVPPKTIFAWLTGGFQDVALGLRVALREIWEGLGFWLGGSDPFLCDLLATGRYARNGPAPALVEFEGNHPASLSVGVLLETGLCLLWLAPAGRLPAEHENGPREVMGRAFGPPGREAVAARLRGHLEAWEAAGRPGSQGMRVEVYPADSPITAQPGEILVTKRWTRLLISWPQRSSRRPTTDDGHQTFNS